MTRFIEDKSTTGLSLYELTGESVWGWVNEKLIEWLGEVCDIQLGAITNPGSGYTDGVYPNVELRRTAAVQTGGNHLLCEVTIVGGGVSSVTVTQKGNGFKTGDELTIPNLAQVGGAGSGFTINVDSADASLGFIYDARRSGAQYNIGFMLGAERDLSYSRGVWVYKTSSRDDTNIADFYTHAPNSNNNSYGNFTQVGSTQSVNTWYPGNGDGYSVRVAYSSEPGDRWFVVLDTAYYSTIGFFETLRDPAYDWPERTTVSPWGHLVGANGNTFSARQFITVPESTAYFGMSYNGFSRPSDPDVLYTGQLLRGRAFSAGVFPPGLGLAVQSTPNFGKQLQDGTELWNQLGDKLYGRTSV